MNLKTEIEGLTNKSELTASNLPDLISVALHRAVALRRIQILICCKKPK